MRYTFRALAVSSLMALAFASFAQTHFVSRPGVQELSGRMVVRPFSESDWQARGLSLAQAQAKVREAVSRASVNVIRRATETGEIIIRVPAGQTEDRVFFNLNATGLYQYVVPDYRVFPLARPNDTFYNSQWHHVSVKSEKGWDLHTGRNHVTVAICDTGVDLTHPDLAPNLVPGYNAPQRRSQAAGGDVMDLQGHGTHVAGDAAAIGNNARGVAGMGWNFKIMPIKIVEGANGGAFISDMLDGAMWATNNGAKVSNVSFGGVMSPSVQVTGEEMKKRGALLVFAGGNSQENITTDHKDVIIVSATNRANQYAGWPAFGIGIDLMAPGEDIQSTTMGGGYGPATGTSMAAPIVAGALAQIYSYNPRLTAQQVEDILSQTATSIGDANRFGFGLINMEKAMLRVRSTLTVAQIIPATSITQQDGTHTSGGLIDINNIDKLVYKARSSRVNSGQSAGAVATFTLPTPSKIVKMDLMAASLSSRTQYPVSNTLFLWNWQTSKYDLIAESALKALGEDELVRALSGASLAKYMNGSGQVRLLVRAYSADRRNTGMAQPFDLMINRLVIGIELQN